MSLRSLGIFATLTLAGATSLAQAPDQDWAACRAALTCMCVIAEARRTLEAFNQPASRAEAVDMLVGDLIDGKRVLDAYALLPALRQDGDSLPVRTRLAAAQPPPRSSRRPIGSRSRSRQRAGARWPK